VLVVEDEQCIRDILAELFEVEGTETEAVGTLPDAQAALARRPFDLIVTDLRLGGKRNGGAAGDGGVGDPVAGRCGDRAHRVPGRRQPPRVHAARARRTSWRSRCDLRTIAELAAQAGVATALLPNPSGATTRWPIPVLFP
jgi:hypothetical protein